jgi:hypothetical protein
LIPVLFKGLTQAEVRLELAQRDVQDIRYDQMIESHVGPSTMIHMGLELEDSKYVQVSKITLKY